MTRTAFTVRVLSRWRLRRYDPAVESVLSSQSSGTVPIQPMDPLSDVLSLLKPRSYMAGGMDVGGDLSIQFPMHDGIKCYAMVSGQCWLFVEGVPDPSCLGQATAYSSRAACPSPRHRPSLPPVDALTLSASHTSSRTPHPSTTTGGRDSIVGGHFILTGRTPRSSFSRFRRSSTSAKSPTGPPCAGPSIA